MTAPRLMIRVARPFTEPILLGQSVTFHSNGWQFTGSVIAITRPPGQLDATDLTLEASG